MKLATFSTADKPARVGMVTPAGIVDIARLNTDIPTTMLQLIEQWASAGPLVSALAEATPHFQLSEVTLHAPVPRPRKILAIGLNYADHVAESHLKTPLVQTWFAKMPTAACGPFDDVELPTVSEQLDHEVELVFFIGKKCRNLLPSEAKGAIFGYCVGNDFTVRDWQFASSQWTIGKSFDTHAPMGPWLTTADEIDPHGLDLRLLVNGEIRQQSNTRNLIFDCFAQVEYLSKAMTLEPGDAVFTGTCGGVGFSRKPPQWLREGDLIRVEIAKLGHIENRVARNLG